MSKVREAVTELLKEDPMWADVDIDAICFYGNGGIFDSLDLVNFIIGLEKKLGMSLSTDKAFSHRNSPFSSLENLEDFVKEIEDEHSNNRNK